MSKSKGTLRHNNVKTHDKASGYKKLSLKKKAFLRNMTRHNIKSVYPTALPEYWARMLNEHWC